MITRPHKCIVAPDRVEATEEMLDKRLNRIEKLIDKAELYAEKGENVTDHPDWVANRLLPSYYKWRARTEKTADRLAAKNKDKKLAARRQNAPGV